MKELSRKEMFFYRILDYILLVFSRTFQRKRKRREGLNNFTPKKILLVEFHGIGDLAILSGVIDPIKKRWPEADVWLLAKPFAQELFGHDSRVRGVFTFNFPWATWKFRYNFLTWPWIKLCKLIRHVRSINFDFVLGRPDLPMSLLISLLNAKYTFGYDLPGGAVLLTNLMPSNQTTNDHEQKIWEGYLGMLGIDSFDYRPRIVLDNRSGQQAEHVLKGFPESTRELPLIGIHPGASHRLQRWPQERFSKVAKHFSKRARVIWFLDDSKILSGLHENTNFKEVSVPIPTFLHLLSSCKILIANDSGPMHLAATLNTQVIAIFGPQLPERFAPRRFCKPISIRGIPCCPCGNRCQYKYPKCLTSISVEEVINTANNFLKIENNFKGLL